MARFSQAFLQGLLQPTYQQGLFEAARGVGQLPAVMDAQRQQEERQKELTNLLSSSEDSSAPIAQRINILTQKAQEARIGGRTQEAIALENAAASLQTRLKTQGAGQITNLMQQLDRAIDPANITALQNQINQVAIDTLQSDPTKFVGLGTKRKEKVIELFEDRSRQRVDNMANIIARSEVDISAYIDSLPSVQDNPETGVTEAERGSLLKVATDLRQIRNDHTELRARGTLSPKYKEILDNNSELRESPAVAEALEILAKSKDPKQTVSPGSAARAADTIRDAVTKEYGRQLEIDRSTNRLEAKADRMVDALLEEGGISEWVYGEDLVEIVDRIKDEGRGVTEEMKDDFYSFIAQEIEKNPEVDRNVAIKTALDLLGEEYDLRLEEGRQQNVEERQQEEADREDAITSLMEKEDLSRKDAIRRLNAIHAERVMQMIGQQSVSQTSYQ